MKELHRGTGAEKGHIEELVILLCALYLCSIVAVADLFCLLQKKLTEDEAIDEGQANEPQENPPAAPALQEVDPFASSAPTGLVETERDRLIRLVRPVSPR